MIYFKLSGQVALAAKAARSAVNAIPETMTTNSLGEPKTLVGIGVKGRDMTVKLLGDIAGNKTLESKVEEAINKAIENLPEPKKRTKK